MEVQTYTGAAVPGTVPPLPDPLPTRSGFETAAGFELIQRGAKALAASDLVGPQFHGNIPNCIIALELASRMGASPLLVMQNLYVVYGKPGWSAKFLIATWNACGRFTSIRYRESGTRGSDDWGCQAYAHEKATGLEIVGPAITIGLAKREGWYGKKDSKWQTIPELMLRYRAAAWMINTHAPELSMGIRTTDEIVDMGATEIMDAVPAPPKAADLVAAAQKAAVPVPPAAPEAPPQPKPADPVRRVRKPREPEAPAVVEQPTQPTLPTCYACGNDLGAHHVRYTLPDARVVGVCNSVCDDVLADVVENKQDWQTPLWEQALKALGADAKEQQGQAKEVRG